MKQWQVEALERVDQAALRMKEQILKQGGDWEKARGEISVSVSKTTYHPDQYHNVQTMSTRLFEWV